MVLASQQTFSNSVACAKRLARKMMVSSVEVSAQILRLKVIEKVSIKTQIKESKTHL